MQSEDSGSASKPTRESNRVTYPSLNRKYTTSQHLACGNSWYNQLDTEYAIKSGKGKDLTPPPSVNGKSWGKLGIRRLHSIGGSSEEATTQPSKRLEYRRCAVSASEATVASELLRSSDEEDSDEMPLKRNTFRITARFIGSMQRHAVPKSKAEKAATAAYLATYMTDQYRYIGQECITRGILLKRPCKTLGDVRDIRT